MINLVGDVLGSRGWIRGELVLNGASIYQVKGHSVSEDEVMSSSSLKYIPGFIDLHVHGCAGVDLMTGKKSLEHIARHQPAYGTTSFLATTMTAPFNEVEGVLSDIQGYLEKEPVLNASAVLGTHLEGPYISPERLGAQPAMTRAVVLNEILHLHQITPIRVLTLAPECVSDDALITHLSQLGIRVQIGHSKGCYEDGVRAMNQGVAGFTHLFNAMTAMHHREPGMVGAALAHAQYAELIPDLLHVHPGAIKVALRSIPHLYCVTDGTAATGMPDGAYMLGSQSVNKCLGGVRLADGTLAGSTLTMIEAFNNLCSIGLTLMDASHRLSQFPAQYLGINDRGVLDVGAIADVVVLDSQLNLQQVYVRGEVYES